MNAIADALVYAVTYINLRGSNESVHDDGDVAALESIAGMLKSATKEEKNALAAAVERALANELSCSPRKEFVQEYGTWMENLFGEGWDGNKRGG